MTLTAAAFMIYIQKIKLCFPIPRLPPQSKLPCKVVFPDTFNDDIHVVAPFNLVVPLTFNELKLVKLVKKKLS